MPKIAICDDDPWMREYLSDFVRRSLQIKAALFEDGEALLASSLDFDILFLDICLGPSDDAAAQDGMETAKRLRRRSNALIIFITAMPEYVYDAYDVEAFHYLLKPIDEEKLLRVLNRAVEKTRRTAASPVLSVKANGTCRSIPAKDIYYAESRVSCAFAGSSQLRPDKHHVKMRRHRIPRQAKVQSFCGGVYGVPDQAGLAMLETFF